MDRLRLALLFWSFIVLLLAVSADDAAAPSNPGGLQVAELCERDGAGLQCGLTQQLHVDSVTCGQGEQPCVPGTVAMLRRLCQGQRSCADLGLQTIFDYYCGSSLAAMRKVMVHFRCVPGEVTTCRANLCSPTGRLACPMGGKLHIQQLMCGQADLQCMWRVYVTVYTLCEGRSECAAAGLLTLLPVEHCQHQQPSLRSVMVEYVCLPEEVVHTGCPKNYARLEGSYGVVLSPGFVSPPLADSRRCTWRLPVTVGQTVKVMVHLAYSKSGLPDCSSQYLTLHFSRCPDNRPTNRSFCDLSKVNQEVTSCGDIYVTSWLPVSSARTGDKFLISFQVLEANGTPAKGWSQSKPPQQPSCGPLPPPPSPPSPPTTTPTALSAPRNYAPSDSLLPVPRATSDSGVQPDMDPGTRFKLEIKLVALYIFFGVVIVALLVALGCVIVSYRGIGRKGGYKPEKSEKQALWKHEDTPLEMLGNSAPEGQASSPLSDSRDGTLRGEGQEGLAPMLGGDRGLSLEGVGDMRYEDPRCVVATVHVDSPTQERPREGQERPREGQELGGSGTGFSSFIVGRCGTPGPGSQNPYASYSSLPDPDLHTGNGTLPSAGGNSAGHESSKPRRRELPPMTTDIITYPLRREEGGVQHYTINDDDYALVQPSHRRKERSVSTTKENPVYDPQACDPLYDNLEDNSFVGFRPTSGPYDKQRNSAGLPGCELNFQFGDPRGWDDGY